MDPLKIDASLDGANPLKDGRPQRARRVEFIGECWAWPRTITGKGYGQISVNGKRVPAHRFFYEAYFGPVPSEFVLDHLCENKACVSPFHLQPTTNRENVLRGTGPTAINARKLICSQGHPLFGDNLYIYPNGRRSCRICRKEYSRQWNLSTSQGA